MWIEQSNKRESSPTRFVAVHVCSEMSNRVPKGPPTIARRFNAGYDATAEVPKGRPMIQPSLRDEFGRVFPGVETPGFFYLSLRDQVIDLSQSEPRITLGSSFPMLRKTLGAE
jgi:hypothetical protein